MIRTEKVGGTLWIVATRLCNFACKYCYQGADHGWQEWKKKQQLKRTITPEVLEATVGLLEHWMKPGGKINWYGGEPLLAYDLMTQWVPKYHSMGFKQGVTTNGALLNADVRQLLDMYDVGVLFSLDGPPWLHNRTRVLAGGQDSYSKIPWKEILEWRPDIEIAWQIAPATIPRDTDIDYMVNMGFKRINFNLNWMEEWAIEQQETLRDFFQMIGRKCIKGELRSNWHNKLDTMLTRPCRLAKPCGTGLGMLAVTPEGWLYPSQEMAFTVFEPGKAEGTAEYYRIGNVLQTPIFDEQRMEAAFDLKTEQMQPPTGYDCDDCHARLISLGGCHCRYVGQGNNPANRFEVELGYCQSMRAAAAGLLQAAQIEQYKGPQQKKSAQVGTPVAKGLPKKPLNLLDLDHKLDRILHKLEEE